VFDVTAKMREMAETIRTGRFADEWDAERDAGYPTLEALKETHAGAGIRELEAGLRRRLGPDRDKS
jgi:ketol-acid reductoisomerase